MGISSETTIPGISSETTETRESRVRRRNSGPDIDIDSQSAYRAIRAGLMSKRHPNEISMPSQLDPTGILIGGQWQPNCIPLGSPSAHSRFPGLRRPTRDSWNRRLTRDSHIPDFACKKLRKNRTNRFFGFLGPK